MKRPIFLIMGCAVAATLAAPLAMAQQRSDTYSTSKSAPGMNDKSMSPGTSGKSTTPGMNDESTGSGMKSPSSGSSSASSAMPQQYAASTVREVQEALKDKGINTGPVDGILGPKTRAAVKQFQEQQGMSASGKLNHETLAALDVETNKSGSMGASSAGGGSSGGSQATKSSGSSSSMESGEASKEYKEPQGSGAKK